MTILHVSTALSWRGGEQQLIYLYQELEKRYGSSLQQFIFCVKKSTLAHYCEKYQLQYGTCKKIFSLNPYFAYVLSKYARHCKADIVHTHDSHAHSMAVIAADLFGVKQPIVVARRVDFAISNSFFSMYKYNHMQVKKIICVSKAIAQISAHSIKDKSKIMTIYSGIDIEKFTTATSANYLCQRYNIPENNVLIGNVAALAPHKDYITFIQTATHLVQKLDYKKLMFFIIGEGSERSSIQLLIKTLNMEDHIKLTGFLNNIPEVLKELDIFFISSETEGLGTSVIDACASGLPIVATKAGGIPEIIEHQKNGLLATVKDIDTLVQHLQLLIDNEPLRQQLASNAQLNANRFNKARMAMETYSVYQMLTDVND